MKLLLVFALCGVTCCLAGATCGRDEQAKCKQGPPGQRGTKEEELDKLCKQITCYIEVYDRCGAAGFTFKPIPVKGYRKVVNTVCDTSNPLRQKYLDNVECVKSVTKQDDLKRLSDTCGLEEIVADTSCRVTPKAFICSMNYIILKCGEEAGEVFRVAGLPYFDPNDCLSTFDE